MNLVRFIVRRLFIAAIITYGVLVITFFLTRFMPGNPFLQESISIKGDPDVVRKQLEYYGLNQPIWNHFLIYMRNTFNGDWGVSLAMNEDVPVWDLIKDKFPITLEYGTYSILISSFIGIKTGTYSATHRNKPGDVIILKEWDPKTKKYTGREIKKKVNFVLKTKEMQRFHSKDELDKYGLQVIQLEK